MSLEKEFDAFEEAFRKLSREYDVFLYGSSHGKMPVDARKRLEDTLRALTARKMDAAADRYRLNSITGRFNAERERWERAVRDKEEGRGRFARAGGVAGTAPNAPAASSVKPSSAADADRELYERYAAARSARGEKSPGYDAFRAQLAKEREKLQEKTGRAGWDFEIAETDGRVRIVARPGKGSNG
jgi:hypothetical protein